MRLAFFAGISAIFFAAPAIADDKEKDKPKPNTLTTKEIADGWILLFDGETTFGWKIDGAAEVKDGVLIFGKGNKTTASPTSNCGFFEVKVDWQGDGTVYYADRKTCFRSDNFTLSGSWGEYQFERDKGYAGYRISGVFGEDTPVKDPHPELLTAPFVIETDGKTEAHIRSIKLRPQQTNSLFTGKNLGGWKVNAADAKRMASKWEVTKDGELSLKNGSIPKTGLCSDGITRCG